jgi:sec-independent protein translocase protein TatA
MISTPGPLELMVILAIALIVLGPKRLPDAARSVGRGVREFRESLSGLGDDDDEDEHERFPEPDEDEDQDEVDHEDEDSEDEDDEEPELDVESESAQDPEATGERA